MVSFWIFAGLLIAIALCYVLPPLLGRVEQTDDGRERANVSIYQDGFAELDRDLRDGVLDKEQYEQGRLELQRGLLEDVASAQEKDGATEPAAASARSGRETPIVLGTAIPLLAVLLYFQIGTPQALAPGQPALSSGQEEAEDAPPARAGGAPTQQEIEKRVANLATRLKENPNDAQGWAMLGRSYQSFKRYREASDAYARAAELVGNDAQLWADYAEALALANGAQLQGQPLILINKALQIDPDNEAALWLAGNAAFQARDFLMAVSHWERLEKLLPEGSEAAQTVSDGLAEARAQISSRKDVRDNSSK